MLLKIFLLIPTSDSEIVLEVLPHDMKNLLNWFKINSMKPNPKKKFNLWFLDQEW